MLAENGDVGVETEQTAQALPASAAQLSARSSELQYLYV